MGYDEPQPSRLDAPCSATAPAPEVPVYATPGVTGLDRDRSDVLLAPVRPSVLALQDALADVLAESCDDPATTAEVAALSRIITGAQAALLDRVDGVDRAGTWAWTGR